MAAVQFTIPYPIVALPTNVGAPGAKLYFYAPGTTTIVPVYASSALTTQLPNPVVADSAGRTATIWLNGANTYKLVIKSKSGAVLYTARPVHAGDECCADDGHSAVVCWRAALRRSLQRPQLFVVRS
jgi:hypothetical protein